MYLLWSIKLLTVKLQLLECLLLYCFLFKRLYARKVYSQTRAEVYDKSYKTMLKSESHWTAFISVVILSANFTFKQHNNFSFIITWFNICKVICFHNESMVRRNTAQSAPDHTGPHRTQKISGQNWPDSPAYTWPRYTIPEGVRMLIFNSYPGMNWK